MEKERFTKNNTSENIMVRNKRKDIDVTLEDYTPKINEDDIKNLLDLCIEVCCVNMERKDNYD